ncbi:zinc ribbon domain-containing protein [Bradyrhizobium tropiciagri]|uniref:zinc ribbon domain-containing protein n=1 Tax=Bradyrhizobium tropiciagri TaxID=312253 RepID=UPI003D9AD720
MGVSPRTIRTLLEYKAIWYGSRIIVVDPAHTSQTCSACGAVDAASRIAGPASSAPVAGRCSMPT